MLAPSRITAGIRGVMPLDAPESILLPEDPVRQPEVVFLKFLVVQV